MSSFLGPEFNTKDLVFYFDTANSKSYVSGTNMSNLVTSEVYDMQFSVTPNYNSSNLGTIGFNGTTMKGTINNVNYPYDTNDEFTLQIWLNIPTGASWSNGFYSNILGRGDYAGFTGIVRSTIDNEISVVARTLYSFKSLSTTITNNSWNQLTMTMDTTTLSMYKNGVLVSSLVTGFTYSTYDSTYPYVLAGALATSGSLGNSMSGTVSIVGLWSKSLNAQDVLKTYNATKTRFGHL